jgi:hypothetical protein
MDQLAAMRETVELMEAKMSESFIPYRTYLDPSLSPDHVRDMLRIMESGSNPQDTERGFSEGKMGRWLGWAQAAVVAMGVATLEDMKDINRKHAD